MTDNLWMSFIADDPEQVILYCSSPDGSNHWHSVMNRFCGMVSLLRLACCYVV